MRIPWADVFAIAGKVGRAVLTGVPIVEAIAANAGGKSGPDKRRDVLAFVQAELAGAAAQTGRDLSGDPDVLHAVGQLVDDVAELHNVLTRRVLQTNGTRPSRDPV